MRSRRWRAALRWTAKGWRQANGASLGLLARQGPGRFGGTMRRRRRPGAAAGGPAPMRPARSTLGDAAPADRFAQALEALLADPGRDFRCWW